METKGSLLVGKPVSLDSIHLSDIFEKITRSSKMYRVAIISEEGQFTFSQLNSLANRWARILLKLMAKQTTIMKTEVNEKPPVIGVFIQENLMRMVTLLAIFKLGAAYVPLDDVLPSERMCKIVKETNACMVICQSEEHKNLLCCACDIFAVVIKDFEDELQRSKFDNNIRREELSYAVEEDPVLCILYTSGSTGEPKGVPLRNHNLLNRLSWQWKVFPSGSDDVGCHKTSLLFVDSLTEMFGCLLQAIPLVIIPKKITQSPLDLMNTIIKYKVTKIILVPSLLASLLNELKRNDQASTGNLKMVVCGGEALNPDLAKDFLSTCPGILLANYYGSTETTGDVSYEIFTKPEDVELKQDSGFLSIGIPVANNNIVVMDSSLVLIEEGQVGDILVSGPNIVTSYMLGKEPESFVKNPLSQEHQHSILYKTGDIGKVKDGRLYYQGRRDSQIKVRGHRVNLREIELTLDKIDIIDHISVVAVSVPKTGVVVLAYYKVHETLVVSRDQIIKCCKKILPSYMIPVFIEIDEVPLQPQTGKIDRLKLQTMYLEQRENGLVPDAKLCHLSIPDLILALISRETGVPIHLIEQKDNFFDISGNSISALSIVLTLQNLGYSLTVSDLLESITIQNIIDALERRKHGYQGSTMDLCRFDTIPKAVAQGFEVCMLNHCADKEQVAHIVAEAFSQKSPLEVLLGTAPESFVNLINNIWTEIVHDNLSIAVCEISTGRIVGTTIILELRTDIKPNFYRPEVVAILDKVQKPMKDKLKREGGKWVGTYLNAVDVNLSDGEQLLLLQMMEDEVTKVAQRQGYEGIFTVNTHPVTIDMAEQMYGYEVCNSLHVKSFEYQRQFPFANADDTYFIKAMVKRLK